MAFLKIGVQKLVLLVVLLDHRSFYSIFSDFRTTYRKFARQKLFLKTIVMALFKITFEDINVV